MTCTDHPESSPLPRACRGSLSGSWSLGPKSWGPPSCRRPLAGVFPLHVLPAVTGDGLSQRRTCRVTARGTERRWRRDSTSSRPGLRLLHLDLPSCCSQNSMRSLRKNSREGQAQPQSSHSLRDVRGTNDAVMLRKCCTQYASKSGKLSSG